MADELVLMCRRSSHAHTHKAIESNDLTINLLNWLRQFLQLFFISIY